MLKNVPFCLAARLCRNVYTNETHTHKWQWDEAATWQNATQRTLNHIQTRFTIFHRLYDYKSKHFTGLDMYIYMVSVRAHGIFGTAIEFYNIARVFLLSSTFYHCLLYAFLFASFFPSRLSLAAFVLCIAFLSF